MTAAATTAAARPDRRSRADAFLDAALAAFPLVGAYLLLAVFYAWHAQAHGSPWLFSDEVEYTQLARAIADTGEPTRRGESWYDVSLYTYVLAPVWWLFSDVPTAYSAAKYLGAFLMSSAIFPSYWLARLLVPRVPALLAAVAATAIPALAYSRLLLTEVLAYPVVALAFFLIARGLATWSLPWLLAATVLVLLAPEVREQLAILVPTFAGAALVALWLSDRARRYRAAWGPREWLGVVLALGVGVSIAHKASIRQWEQYYLATTLPDRAWDFLVWASGAFVIGVGVVPVVAALVALWRPRDAEALPAYRAVAGLFAAAVVCFLFYTTVKTVFLSTVFANVVAERNLIYLSPLVFALAALVAWRPSASPLVLTAATVAVAYLVVTTPYQLDHYPYSDAPGLSVLAWLNREWAMDDLAVRQLLTWIVAGSMLLLGLAALARGRSLRVAQGALAAVGVAVIAWNVTGNASFGGGINDLANRVRSAVPSPPNWVDRATGGERTAYLGFGIADANPILVTEFWNRSIVAVGSLDGTAPGPGPTYTPIPYRTDGAVLNDPDVRYVVTSGGAVDVEGALVERSGDWRLIRLDGPLRLRSSTTGVYPDGWSGPAAAFNRFGEGERGVVDVLVSRVGWTGEDRPGRVTIRVGRLRPQPVETIANPCRPDGTCVSQQPEIAGDVVTRRWTAHAREQQLFTIPVTTPFRVEVTVDPTFATTEFGGTDPRQLGVQVAFAFKPRR